MSEIVWRGMTRAELDKGYNNTDAVADSGTRRDGWVAPPANASAPNMPRASISPTVRCPATSSICSAAARPGRRCSPSFTAATGSAMPRRPSPAWQRVPWPTVMDVAFLGYTLAPEATLPAIVGEIADAIRWLRREGPRHGVGQRRLVVSGWSAGGHLTATTLAMDEVDAGLAISGIYDVEPCRLNYLNDNLRLTAAQARKPVDPSPAEEECAGRPGLRHRRAARAAAAVDRLSRGAAGGGAPQRVCCRCPASTISRSWTNSRQRTAPWPPLRRGWDAPAARIGVVRAS